MTPSMSSEQQYQHSELAHNTFRKVRLQKTFDLIAQLLIIGFVGVLVYYNALMLVPHLTPLFWALLFAVLLYKPLKLIIAALHFIDEKIADVKLKIYLSTAALYFIFLLSSSLLTIVVISSIFAVWTFLLFGERQSVGAILLLALLCVALGLPTYYTVITCVHESTVLATRIQNFVEENSEFQTLLDDFGSSPYYIWATDYAKQWGVDLPVYNPQLIKDKIVEFSMQFSSHITNALGSIVGVLSSGVQVMISFITFASSLYYFLVHLDTVTAILPEISPFSDEDSLVLVNSLHRSVTQIFLSSFLIFLSHLCGTWVIFKATQVELTLVLSVLAGFTSILPILGSYIVWIPVAIAKLATGQHLQALAITIVQLILQFPIDMAIYSIIPGNAFLVAFSLAMGMYIFGFLGILVGPLLAGILITVINMYAVYQRLPRLKIKSNEIEVDLNESNITSPLSTFGAASQNADGNTISMTPLQLSTTLSTTPLLASRSLGGKSQSKHPRPTSGITFVPTSISLPPADRINGYNNSNGPVLVSSVSAGGDVLKKLPELSEGEPDIVANEPITSDGPEIE
jgi:predicted PurR-regulated permease PerM